VHVLFHPVQHHYTGPSPSSSPEPCLVLALS
jgi:hypothetical protein